MGSFKLKEMTTGGMYFKPEEHTSAVALLIEPTRFQPQAPSKFGPKDAVWADVTVFATQADLDAGKPSSVYANTQIQQTVLVKNLTAYIDSATVATITQLPPQNGNRAAWAFEKVSADVTAKVVAYGEKREAELVAAVAAAPDFD